MEKPPKPMLKKNRKRKISTTITAASEPKTLKIETLDTTVKPTTTSEIKNTPKQKKQVAKIKPEVETAEDAYKKYPILQDQELVNKFLKVPFTNNQKGRIRQAINLQLKDSSNHLIPDVIHGKIQAILNNSKNLTDAELRRIRILYNMLKTSIQKMTEKPDSELNTAKPKTEKEKKKKEKKVRPNMEGEEHGDENEKKDKKDQMANKPRGPKRYVVFVGNLPLDIDKEKLMDHFSEINDQIKDVRLPPPAEGKKSAIAFIELSNEPSYEIALSKHHSMMGNKRINVLYTAQQNSKISKAEAKSKSAKLIALQKSGKLLGSVPLVKKRSHRRMKMKQARAKEAAASA